MVDDEVDVNTTIRQVLEDNGFKVDSYEDPQSALNNFKPHYYDLVLIDIKMPQMNGFAFHKVKSQDKEVKTCFLTAGELRSEHYPDDIFSSLSSNCLIQIPIENDRLLERIEEIMAEVK